MKKIRIKLLVFIALIAVSFIVPQRIYATENQENEQGEQRSRSEESKINICDTKELTLRYDDHTNLDDIMGEGYVVAQIVNDEIHSRSVSKGVVTEQSDKHIVTLKENSNKEFDASAIGSGYILAVRSADYDIAKQIINNTYTGEKKIIDATKINISVSPARLTMLFVAGQSNAQGSCSLNTGYHPEDSVVNKEGTVYSTYAPYTAAAGKYTTGIQDIKACNITNIDKFAAGNLTSGKSVHGGNLTYGIDSLTYAGNGKTGIDGALAYEWNRLAGDKVWVINAGAPGTSSNLWVPGAECYERAVALFNMCSATAQAEVAAGHYVMGNKLMFWLQGEQDAKTKVSNDTYMTNFMAMYNGMTAACGIEHTGIIAVRASTGSYQNYDELKLTCSRYSQYAIANRSAYDNISMVSNINEKWVSDQDVAQYFWGKYSGGYLTYPLRSNATIGVIPTTVAQVHNEIHYAQVGHNENGIDAAFNMFYILNPQRVGLDAGTTTSTNVKWRDESGYYAGVLLSSAGRQLVFSAEITPLYNANKVSFSYNPQYMSYDTLTGRYVGIAAGDTQISASDIYGNILSSLDVNLSAASIPGFSVKQTTVQSNTITWTTTDEATSYRLYRSIDSGAWTAIGDFTDTSYIDTDLGYEHTYSYMLQAYYGRAGVWSDATKVYTTTQLARTKLSKIKNEEKGIRLTWDVVKGAQGYYIYRKDGTSNKWKKISNIRTASRIEYLDRKVTNAKAYTYKVVAYNKLGEWPQQNTRSICYVAPNSITRLSVNKKELVSASWRKNTRATGYQLKIITGKKTKIININNRNSNNRKFKLLPKNKSARIYIRSFIKASGKTYYSAWSKEKTVKNNNKSNNKNNKKNNNKNIR